MTGVGAVSTKSNQQGSCFHVIWPKRIYCPHLKKKNNGANDCGNWTLNLDKPTKSNRFAPFVVSL